MAIKDSALRGCVALVTGGSRGIGRAICEALGRRGATVVVNYVSRADAAQESASALEAAGGKAALACFDVADAGATAEGIKRVAAEHGGLHILVNNAGIARNALLLRLRDEDWQRTLDVNLAGVMHCTRAAAGHILRAKERGRIINVSSVVGEMGNAGQSAYAAAKAAVIGFTKSLAHELGPRGVCVNAVTPGYIETDMTAAELSETSREKFLGAIPLGRVGRPEEVGDAVAFLAGPEASYITGAVLRINGGLLT